MIFGRRVKFNILVLMCQLLLIAMTVTWLVQMFLIAKHGRIYIIEENPIVLYGEIASLIIITMFAIIVFIMQWKRLGEKRRDDINKNAFFKKVAERSGS